VQGADQIVLAPTLADLVKESIIWGEINTALLDQHGHARAGDIAGQ
jgi:hypothetical protein